VTSPLPKANGLRRHRGQVQQPQQGAPAAAAAAAETRRASAVSQGTGPLRMVSRSLCIFVCASTGFAIGMSDLDRAVPHIIAHEPNLPRSRAVV